MKRNAFLIIELLAIFGAIPLLISVRVLPNWPIPFLLLVAGGAFLKLRRDTTFDWPSIFSFSGIAKRIGPLLLRDVVLMAALGLAVWWFRPDLLFSLLKRSPGFWALIMVAYPLVSVLPQEVLFRAYFFQRYTPLLGDGWRMIAASALAFGWVHIIFGNWESVALTTFGGVLFATTYQRSRSLMLVCMEHALFGNFIFTIGIGRFFIPGARHF